MADAVEFAAYTYILGYILLKKRELQRNKRKVQRRRWWMLNIHQNRTRESMEQVFSQLLHEPSGQFYNFCRMSFIDFETLLCKISPLISKKDTRFREAIPAKYRLAITLRYLASGDSYQSLHYLFKVSTQSISVIVLEVCRAINSVLKDEIKMPSTSEDWISVERGFRNKFPHCIGSLDGKHVLINQPPHSGSEYYNYKKSFSIVLLALVDSNYRFIYAEVGSQGRLSDGGVLNNSLLWQKICRNQMNFPPPCPLPGLANNVPYIFVGDGAFALSTHIMKPYPGEHPIDSPKRIFNRYLARSRVVVENVFGILSSVFRIFRHPIALNPESATEIIMTCLLLHNFLRKSQSSTNTYTPLGTFDVFDSQVNLVQTGSWRRDSSGYNAIQNLPSLPRRPTSNASQIREEFTAYFSRTLRGPTN